MSLRGRWCHVFHKSEYVETAEILYNSREKWPFKRFQSDQEGDRSWMSLLGMSFHSTWPNLTRPDCCDFWQTGKQNAMVSKTTVGSCCMENSWGLLSVLVVSCVGQQHLCRSHTKHTWEAVSWKPRRNSIVQMFSISGQAADDTSWRHPTVKNTEEIVSILSDTLFDGIEWITSPIKVDCWVLATSEGAQQGMSLTELWLPSFI